MKSKQVKNKVVTAALILSTVVSCMGCGKRGATVAKAAEAVPLKSSEYTNYNRLWEKGNQISIDPNMIKSVKQFSNESALKYLMGTDKNVSYSPISLYFALAVLTEGSEKETAEQLFHALGLEDVDYEYLSQNVDKLYRYLYRDTDITKLKIANAVWMDHDFPFLSSYSDTVSKLYHSSVYNIDFSDKKTPKIMEEWIAKQLDNFMAPKVTIKDDQVMTIMNTIYYSGAWSDEFYEWGTKEDEFYTKKDTTVTCDFMNRSNMTDSYVDGKGYKTYQLPIKGGDSMIFCLPDEGVDIDDLLASQKSINDLFDMSKKEEAEVTLWLPKFDYSCKLDLLDGLSQLGVVNACDRGKADFSKISKKALFLGAASQEVHIKIDEKGIIGAAYTELAIECTCAYEPEELKKITLRYNRPFLYQVVTSNKVPLFTGIVKDPTAN